MAQEGARRDLSRQEMTAPSHAWRSRLVRLGTIWLVVVLVELAAWHFLLDSAFYGPFFKPVTVAVLIAALALSWRVLGRRERDRRGGDRRQQRRRDLRQAGRDLPETD
jgi:cobalamin biosynthesis protein CobD/CbiB